MYDHEKGTEADLIRRAKRGDVKAFSRLYSEIYLDLYKFALYTTKHKQDAEDAVPVLSVRRRAAPWENCAGSLKMSDRSREVQLRNVKR